MTDNLTIRLDGDGLADRQLLALTENLQNLSNFWPLLVPIATSWWRRQFDTEGEFAGARWQALAPATVEAKARAGLRPNILQATGKLKQDASRPTRKQTPTSLTLTIENDYLQYHQDGGPNLPKRPLVFGSPLPPDAARAIDEAAQLYVRTLTDRFGIT